MSTKKLQFVFVCPIQNRVFESEDFRILKNRGVLLDEAGNKVLDAKVRLNDPCPFCGRRHVYHARELLCPFGTSENEQNSE